MHSSPQHRPNRTQRANFSIRAVMLLGTLFLFSFASFTSTPCFAIPQDPFTERVPQAGNVLAKRFHGHLKESYLVSARSLYLGTIQGVLKRNESTKPAQRLAEVSGSLIDEGPSPLRLFRGYVLVRNRGHTPSGVRPSVQSSRKRIAVSGSIRRANHKEMLRFTLRTPRGLHVSGQPMAWRVVQFESELNTQDSSPHNYSAQSSRARVRSVSSRALGTKLCASGPALHSISAGQAPVSGVSGDGTGGPSALPLVSQSSQITKALELMTDCDAECSQELGASQANDRIAEYINDVNTIYPEELGITLVLTKQVRRTSTSVYAPSLTDSLALLERFSSVGASLGDADAKHLITGKSLNNDVLGLAYVEAVCHPQEFIAYGLSSRSSDLLTPIIIAHEIGHNLGASHDTVTEGIMSPRLGTSPPTSFSTFSRNEIASYLENFGDLCLADKAPETNFTLSYRRRTLTGVIGIPEGFSGCTVSLKAGIAKNRQKTVLLSRVLSESETEVSFSLTSIKRVTGSSSSVSRAYFYPSATCTTGGNLEGPLTSVKVSSSRPSASGLRGAKGWIRAVRNRLLD